MADTRTGRKHSDETRQKIGAAQQGTLSNSWKGDDVGYAAMHERLYRIGGPCKLCGKRDGRLEWALIHGRGNKTSAGGLAYSSRTDDYMRLCVRCHRRYDAQGADCCQAQLDGGFAVPYPS